MWSKRNRTAICFTIYHDLFWREKELLQYDHTDEVELTWLDESIAGDTQDKLDTKLVHRAFEFYRLHQDDVLHAKLDPFLQDRQKTFPIVTAILFTYLIEVELNKTTEDIASTCVGKYIKLTQDYIAGGNTSLVHAILSKMSGKELPETLTETESTDTTEVTTTESK